MPDTATIQFTAQRRGLNFYLHPATHAAVENISGADPSRSNVFIGFETQEEFRSLLGSIEEQVIILLTGLNSERLLEHFAEIEFQRMPSGETERRLRS